MRVSVHGFGKVLDVAVEIRTPFLVSLMFKGSELRYLLQGREFKHVLVKHTEKHEKIQWFLKTQGENEECRHSHFNKR